VPRSGTSAAGRYIITVQPDSVLLGTSRLVKRST